MNRHVVDVWLQRAAEAEEKKNITRMEYCLQQAEKADQTYDKIQKRKMKGYNYGSN